MSQKQTREKYNKSLIDNINNSSDNVITDIYDKMWELCDEEDDKKELLYT